MWFQGNAEEEPVYDTIYIDEIVIETSRYPSPTTKITTEEILETHAKDLGEVFKNVPGFNMIKRGGFAIEPIFRSYKYEQLNIQFNGATKVCNACPNRMDPITIHAAPEEIEKIEVIRGPYSVRYGETMGGIINMVTNTFPGYVDNTYRVSAETGFESNGRGVFGRGDVLFGNQKYDVRINGGVRDFRNYTAGNGDEILSSFRTYDYSAKVGLNIAGNQRVQVTWRQNFMRDILHAGLPMDAKEDNSSILSVDYWLQPEKPKVSQVLVKGYASWVDHLMTNEWRPNYKSVHALTDVISRTFGGRAEAALNLKNGSTLYVGLNEDFMMRDGARTREIYINPCNGMAFDDPKFFTDLVWQDSYTQKLGVYAEFKHKFNPKVSILSGIRADHILSGIKDPAPDFAALYPDLGTDNKVNFNWHGSVLFKANKAVNLEWAVGQGSRAPELTERYINHFSVGADAHEYVGNPNLKSENNFQSDIILKVKKAGFQMEGDVFYSYVHNYITAIVDTTIPRKYMPCKQPAFAKRFENAKSVHQVGGELSASYTVKEMVTFSGQVSYTWAQNASFNEPLAQVPPLSSRFGISFTKGMVDTELSTRVVAAQNRISESFSESTTDRFATLDYTLVIQPNDKFKVDFAIMNILDKTYSEHLSRAYKNQTEMSPFYEPGRNFKIGMKIAFGD